MSTIRPLEIGEYVPGSGYLLSCQYKGCQNNATYFYSKRPETRFCCSKCRSKDHYQKNKEKLATSRLALRKMTQNDRILENLYNIYGNDQFSMELLKSNGFIPDAASTPVRNDLGQNSGDLFIKFILCRSNDKEYFRIFREGQEYDRT